MYGYRDIDQKAFLYFSKFYSVSTFSKKIMRNWPYLFIYFYLSCLFALLKKMLIM